MNDNGRDDLDRALGDGLSALAPDVADPDVVLGGMRPQLRRARTRHRVTQASSVVAVLLVFGGAAALASNRSTSGHVDVAAPSTSASPTTGRTHNSTTTATTAPRTQTTSPDRGGSVTTVPVVVPPATTSGSHGSPGGPGDGKTTTSVAQSEQHTYSSAGGSVTVNLHSGALALVSYRAAPGYTAEVHSTQTDDVEVRFSKDGTEWRVRVRLDHGQLVPEISQH